MKEIIAAVLAFANSNIDDLFILLVLFSQINGKSLQIKHIIFGQYISLPTLVTISIIGALGVLLIPSSWIGLLGLVPIYMGIKGLTELKKEDDEDDQVNLDNVYSHSLGGKRFTLGKIKDLGRCLEHQYLKLHI